MRAVSAKQDLYLKHPRKHDPCLKYRTCISPMRFFTIKFNRRRGGVRRLKIKFNIAVRLRRDRMRRLMRLYPRSGYSFTTRRNEYTS